MTDPWLTSHPSYNASNLSGTPTTVSSCGNNEGFKFLVYTITYFLVLPVNLICNSLALCVFLCLMPKKTANTVFMTNLALSDLGFSLTLPFRLVYYQRGGHWDFPDWLCRWCVFSFYLNLYTSVLFLTGLSVLRYVAVVHPIRIKTLVTVRRASWLCLGIWVFVAATSSPSLLSGTLKHQAKTSCFEPGGPVSWRRILTLNYIGVVFGFLMPFLTILACYSCIIHRLTAKQQNLKRNQRFRRRSVNMVAVILATFLLCFLPYHLARTAHLHAVIEQHANRPQECRFTELLQKVLVVTLCLAASNSCFNPLLYYFSGETFRNTVRYSSRLRSLNSFNSSFTQGSFLHGRNKSGCNVPSFPVEDPHFILNQNNNNEILDRVEQL